MRIKIDGLDRNPFLVFEGVAQGSFEVGLRDQKFAFLGSVEKLL